MSPEPAVDSQSRLFQPLKVGTVPLNHRVALAPLTRYRNDDEHVALPFMKQYYADRASVPGTLLISEATGIEFGQEGQKYLPSFVTEAQVAAWKAIIQAVHDNGSFFFQQLWDMGRAADPAYIAERGHKYRSSSAIAMEGVSQVPAEMTEAEIHQVIQNFVETSKKVIDAGGDGVEIHAAHGLLIDQFLSDNINKRTDQWGGSIENRTRFLLEVIKAVANVIGAGRVAVRFSPFAHFQGAQKTDTKELYSYIIQQLKDIAPPLAYISLVESKGDPSTFLLGAAADESKKLDFILDIWDNHSPVIVAGGYTPETAAWAVDNHYKKWNVLVAFGRHFLANPDLVFRMKNGLVLNKYDRPSFYLPNTEVGYNDYPFSPEFLKPTA